MAKINPTFDASAAYDQFKATGNVRPYRAYPDQLDAMAVVAKERGHEGFRSLLAREANQCRVNEQLAKPAKERELFIQDASTATTGIIVAKGDGINSRMKGTGLTKARLRRYLDRMNQFVENVYEDPGTVADLNAEAATPAPQEKPARKPRTKKVAQVESPGDAAAKNGQLVGV